MHGTNFDVKNKVAANWCFFLFCFVFSMWKKFCFLIRGESNEYLAIAVAVATAVAICFWNVSILFLRYCPNSKGQLSFTNHILKFMYRNKTRHAEVNILSRNPHDNTKERILELRCRRFFLIRFFHHTILAINIRTVGV